jgi:hypothetical protein
LLESGFKNPSMLCWPASATSIPVKANWRVETLKLELFPTSSFHSLSPAEEMASTVSSRVNGKGACFERTASYPERELICILMMYGVARRWPHLSEHEELAFLARGLGKFVVNLSGVTQVLQLKHGSSGVLPQVW